MYTPKIDPLLIRPLYHLGKARKKPMTQVVNEILFQALSSQELPVAASEELQPAIALYTTKPLQEAA